MPVLKSATLIAGLALWAGQALAQPMPPAYSADGLYNLGNAYAQIGKPGLAVLSYERAALLAPNDPDIEANLAYVRNSAHISMRPRSRFARFFQIMRPTVLAWLGVLGLALVGAGLVARKTASQFKWPSGGGVLLGVALMALSVFNAVMLWPRMHESIVLVDQAPARVSPALMADTAFVLPEAESVTMSAEHEDFILIRTGGGLSGWVARADLGAVVPPAGGVSPAW